MPVSLVKAPPKEYPGSVEFTDEFYTVLEIVNSARWANWMQETNDNWSIDVVTHADEIKAHINEIDKKFDSTL